MAFSRSSIFICFLRAHRREESFGVTNGAIACYLGETDQLPIVDRIHILEQRLSRLEGKG